MPFVWTMIYLIFWLTMISPRWYWHKNEARLFVLASCAFCLNYDLFDFLIDYDLLALILAQEWGVAFACWLLVPFVWTMIRLIFWLTMIKPDNHSKNFCSPTLMNTLLISTRCVAASLLIYRLFRAILISTPPFYFLLSTFYSLLLVPEICWPF